MCAHLSHVRLQDFNCFVRDLAPKLTLMPYLFPDISVSLKIQGQIKAVCLDLKS